MDSTSDNNSMLNTEVSCYKDYRTPDNPRPVNLLTWLTTSKYVEQISIIRKAKTKEERDKLKAKLPAITPSGLFAHRSEKGLIRHSGLIQFDIDKKENMHISNYLELKNHICQIANVAYCGLSASGTGYWGLIPVKEPLKHKEHFEAMRLSFWNYGIVIDTKPRNVASLRGASFDPKGYFNHQAVPMELKVKTSNKAFSKGKDSENFGRDGSFQKCMDAVNQRRVDVTASYEAWFEIGCSLANHFGEQGRDFFHQVSQFHSGYCTKKTDRQFDHCLRHRYNFGIGTFYHHCQKNGITV